MQIDEFLNKLKQQPEAVQFADTMAAIEANYTAVPTAFRNGTLHNSGEQNQGSCKLLAFAQLQGLTAAQTLQCFGDYYRVDVLQNPAGNDHQNIRNFMQSGWQGVVFEGTPLQPR